MRKTKERITILVVGDRPDYDSFRKFHKERSFASQREFKYVETSYKRFLENRIPPIKTTKVIIFLFFPFIYWNKYIEHKGYKGVYGNSTFFKKFSTLWKKVDNVVASSLKGKEIFFVNRPSACALCRDKGAVAKRFSIASIPATKRYNLTRVKDVEKLLNKGHNFFLKPRYGSMGKGITFLSWSNWQTNFIFKNDKIISRRSDGGWKFRDVTRNRKFLAKLLGKDILIEDEINSVILKEMKIDIRLYVFLNKVIYIYPRKNKVDRITTNISQGAKGDPDISRQLPKHIIEKSKKLACKAAKTLGLNLAGIDIMIDRNLKDLYILDINAFPGFPKRRTFNLAQRMIEEITKLRKKGSLRFEKSHSI